jgi:hypothetical protein
MKLYIKSNKVETSVDSKDSLSFGIGDESIIIDFLRNKIYSNKLKSPLQEYVSNGRDANREVGSKKPIHITLPDASNNFVWSVRDHGPGISPDRMESVFVKYGSSTKRDTNKFTGAFGVGSKSCWAYCPSFNITTFIDGIKRQYLALIDASNKGRLDMTYEGPTEESNGTEISYVINQYDVGNAINAISDTVTYWSDEEYPTFTGPVRAIEQLKRERDYYNVRFMGRNFNNIPNTRIGRNVIVVDGIPYPHPGNGKFGTIFVPAGLLTFPITRESIENTPKNLKIIQEIEKDYSEQYSKAFTEWDREIVDILTMHAAISKQAGYSLGSTKEIHNLRINSGRLSFAYQNSNDDICFEPTSINKISQTGDKLYLLPGSRYTKKQLNSIDNKIVIKALKKVFHKELVPNNQGVETEVTRYKWEFSQEFADECIEIAKAHGFTKNLVEHVEKWKPKKKVRATAPVEVFYYDSNDRQKLLDDGNELDKETAFCYYVGRDYDNVWESLVKKFEIFGDRFKNHKLVRLTKKSFNKVKNDSRFIEAGKLINNVLPSDLEVLLALRDSCYYNNMLSHFPKLKKLSKSSKMYSMNDLLRKNLNYDKLEKEVFIIVEFFAKNHVDIYGGNKDMIKEFKNWYYVNRLDANELYKQIPLVLETLGEKL